MCMTCKQGLAAWCPLTLSIVSVCRSGPNISPTIPPIGPATLDAIPQQLIVVHLPRRRAFQISPDIFSLLLVFNQFYRRNSLMGLIREETSNLRCHISLFYSLSKLEAKQSDILFQIYHSLPLITQKWHVC